MISCNQRTKEEKVVLLEQQVVVENVATSTSEIATNNDKKSVLNEIITQTKIKTLPYIETTNFDDFIEVEDYHEVDFEVLGLDNIYPNFKEEGYHYRVLTYYRIQLSDSFYSMVITVKRGDNEMESVLVNYSKEGLIIDHQVVSFDEIAEGMSQIVSRISEKSLTVNHVFWGEVKQIEQVEYSFENDGKIVKTTAIELNKTIENYAVVDLALTDLKLDWVQIKTNLISSKPHPDNPDDFIVVLPRIVNEGEEFLELDSYILVINSRSGEVMHHFYESYTTNGWVSDAVKLDKISIDATAYKVANNSTAFGVKTHHVGLSRVNPYEKEAMSLFIKSGDSLKKILNNFEILSYGGERANDCAGEDVKEQKIITIDDYENNGYFDLLVRNRITVITSNFKVVNNIESGDCITNEVSANETMKLRFDGKMYQSGSKDIGISVLQLLLFTQNQAVKNYGKPEVSEQFTLNDAQGEFRNGILAKYTEQEQKNNTIYIEELTWEKDADTWITAWYEKAQGKARPKEVLEWKKGTEF